MNLFLFIVLISMLSHSTIAFRGLAAKTLASSVVARNMATITTGVEFDTIAREWRLKWTPDNEKKSLATVQQTLDKFGASLKKVDGVKGVQRIVCGGCLDYKVIVSLPADKWAAWEAKKFSPEEEFLTAVKAIPGVSQVETQTYTIMPVSL